MAVGDRRLSAVSGVAISGVAVSGQQLVDWLSAVRVLETVSGLAIGSPSECYWLSAVNGLVVGV